MAPGKKSRHRNESIRAHPVKDADCTEFLQWALPRLGMRWPGFRRVRGQVCKRLRRRMAELGLRDLADYRALLETHPEEWTRLDGLCRISISRFYRDQGVWRTLEREILPRLADRARARGETRLRIWSAGCASGEEPYTLALLFAFSHEGLTECRTRNPGNGLRSPSARARPSCLLPCNQSAGCAGAAGAPRSSRSAKSIAFGPITGDRCASWNRISATLFRRAASI